LLNTVWVVNTVLAVAVPGVSRPLKFKQFAHFIAIPLNSALNPVVYLARKQGMRDYAKEMWRNAVDTI